MLKRVPAAFFDLLSSRAPTTIICLSLFSLILTGALDYLTGAYSVIIFYLAPVTMSTWFVSKRCGLLFCIFTLITRLVIDQTSSFYSYSTLHYWNLLVEFLFLAIVSLLFSSLRKTHDNEFKQASIDPLTGAITRRAFFKLAEVEINRSRRYQRPFSVAYIALDNFKAINDRFGHHVGDQLLITVVAIIKENLRNYEILSRLGGDEFVILLPEADEEATLLFLSKIRIRLQQAMDAKNWPVGTSIGSVIYLTPPATVDEMVGKADELMYSAKHSSKSNILHTIIR